MKIEECPWGAKLIQLESHLDDRGSFLTLQNEELKDKLGVTFVEHLQSHSKAGVIRGLHCQHPPQAKLIRCVAGKILDVVFNREEMKTMAFVLDRYDTWLFLPAGLYHGFFAGVESVVEYFVSTPYNPEAQMTIAYDAPSVKIPWDKIAADIKDFKGYIVSEKDKNGERI